MFSCPQKVMTEVRSRFGARRIVVVGDLMLDRYLWGEVQRISPEAPVPVVTLERETEAAGGAANVARNLAALGLAVSLVGITGNDLARESLLRELGRDSIETGGVLIAADRGTTVKTRVIGNHQQMIRIDEEHTGGLGAEQHHELLHAATARLPGASALVMSDYAKGVLTDSLCRPLIRSARELGIPVVVDPKGRDFSRYAGATFITPNREELALVTGAPAQDLDALIMTAERLREALSLQVFVITLGELGMVIMTSDEMRRIPAVAREVYDVSGAGDTVAATFAAGVAAGLDHVDTAHLANLAAGVVVGKVGTATITADELLNAITGESALERAAKSCNRDQILERVRNWQSRGERVVFTNGCFDLLHVGHVTYLEQARRYGHRLVVGLNTDRSVRAIKGPERPVIAQGDRARLLAALASVDAVVLFDEETPLDLINSLRPDVLAKGADYTEEQVVGAREVKFWGGRVVLIPLVEGRSTTGILGRLEGQGSC